MKENIFTAYGQLIRQYLIDKNGEFNPAQLKRAEIQNMRNSLKGWQHLVKYADDMVFASGSDKIMVLYNHFINMPWEDLSAQEKGALILSGILRETEEEVSKRSDFGNLLEKSGLTLAEFCRLTNTPYQTAKQWHMEGKNGRRVPGIALAWLKLYLKTIVK